MLQKSFESSSFQFQSQNLGKCLLKIDYSELNKIYHCQLKVTTNKSDYEKCFLVKFCKKGNSAREFIMKTVIISKIIKIANLHLFFLFLQFVH